MAQGIPRKHHYLPIFYSKQWAGDDGKVVRFHRPYQTIIDRRIAPAGVGWKEDLYKVDGLIGPDQQALEVQYFSRLDDVAARVHRKLIASPLEPLEPIDVNDWTHFMLSLLHRTPHFIDETRKFGLATWRKLTLDPDLVDRAVSRGHHPDTAREYLTSLTDEDGLHSTMITLPQLIASRRVIELVHNFHWAHYDVPEGSPDLLLSDCPVFLSNGLDNPSGHLAMPLSPQRMVVMAKERRVIEDLNRENPKHIVKRMNRLTVRSAREFVVATDLSQERFISRHFAADPAQSLVGRASQLRS